MLRDLERLVVAESFSDDFDALDRCAGVIAGLGEELLGRSPTVETRDGRSHLLWKGSGPRVLVLAHYDTVWPTGTIRDRGFVLDGTIARGPGVFDMKAGLVQALHAIAAVGLEGVCLLVNGDEEIGSPTSRAIIEREALGCAAVLVAEPAAPGGALKGERKGMLRAQLVLKGRAAHAGLDPESGISTTLALGSVIAGVVALADPVLLTTVTPTVVHSGTVSNAVPDHATVEVDVRAWSSAELDRVRRGLAHIHSGPVSLEVVEAYRREPLTATHSGRLAETAVAVAHERELGAIEIASVGGCSDGNLTAALGIPTLDGLGPVGGGAHAVDEYVVVEEMPRRSALLAGLIERVR